MFVFGFYKSKKSVDFFLFIPLLQTHFLQQYRLTKNRYLREYFISELNNIRDEYKLFFSDIYESRLNAKSIKDRLKVMNVRIDSFERSIHSIYKLDNFSIQIKKVHIEIQQYITGEDEFNQQYKNDAVSFSSAIKSDILRKQSELVEAIIIVL